jgi:hypothetical protein
MASVDRSYARAVETGWLVREIPCGHDVMVAAPDATTAVLLDAAAMGRSVG